MHKRLFTGCQICCLNEPRENVMPIYEYHCKNCDQDFEYLVFGSEKPDCPSCKSKKVSKLMSRCGFISKGSGGETVSSSAGASSCSGCAASSCAGCSH
jgi:putative FmdB family regulatory protein